MGEEPRRTAQHDPRTEWIAEGCSGCLTDAAWAVPTVIVAGAVVLATGLPFWAGVLVVSVVGVGAHSVWTRWRRRR